MDANIDFIQQEDTPFAADHPSLRVTNTSRSLESEQPVDTDYQPVSGDILCTGGFPFVTEGR